MRHSILAVVAEVVSIVALASVSMPAAPAEVALWPTYLRTAPTVDATVIGELSRGKPVTVNHCEERWCDVVVDGASGFVERDRIGPSGPASRFVSNDRPSDCFPSERAGYKAGQPLVICPRVEAPGKSD